MLISLLKQYIYSPQLERVTPKVLNLKRNHRQTLLAKKCSTNSSKKLFTLSQIYLDKFY